MQSEEWVSQEDEKCRNERVARLNWLASIAPPNEGWIFHGALITYYLFEEARYSYVYGLFFATIVLGFAFIEHTLASLLYASGRSDLERANVSLLFKEALRRGWLTKEDFDKLNQAKKIRNPVTHFRKPLDKDTIEFRSVITNKSRYSIIEKDARNVMEVVFHLLSKIAPSDGTDAD